MIITRFADDFVVGFQYRADAEQFLREFRERLRKFSLQLYPEKTRVIEFGRYASSHRCARGEGEPKSFDFLGFVDICGRTRSGKFLVIRRTRPERMRRKLWEIKNELKSRRHYPIPE